MAAKHKALPDGSFIICHLCFNYIEREENEISRHYKDDHQDRPEFIGHKKYPYGLCRLIPEVVAVALVGPKEVNRLKALSSLNSINMKPKAPPATHQELAAMFADRRIPAPAWLATTALVQVPGPVVAAATAVAATATADEEEEDMDEDEDEDDGEDEDEDKDDDDDDMTVDFPLPAIAKSASSRPHIIDEYDRDRPIFHCHVCATKAKPKRVFGNLYDMFCHYNASHPEQLHSRFERMYLDRYLRKLAETTAGDDDAQAIDGDTDEHMLETRAGKCHICMLSDAEEPRRDFWELDAHYVKEHDDERWDLAEIILGDWTNELKK